MIMTGEGVDAVGWSEERVAAAMDFIASRIRTDFEGVTGAPVGDLLTLRIDPTWANDGDWPADRRPGESPRPDDVIAVLFGGRHEFPVGLEIGVEYACYLVADRMQDNLVDELGRPWPELHGPTGRFAGVLEPRYERALACWALRGQPFCAVGQLAPAVPAAGFLIAG